MIERSTEANERAVYTDCIKMDCHDVAQCLMLVLVLGDFNKCIPPMTVSTGGGIEDVVD